MGRPNKYNFIPAPHKKRIVSVVHHAIHRCCNKKCSSYRNYGQRGITVLSEWEQNPVEFAKYLIMLPGWDNAELSIDRIDNDGGYEPNNLRWATRSEQIRNKRNYRGDSRGTDYKCEWCGETHSRLRERQRFCSVRCGNSHRSKLRWDKEYRLKHIV